MTNTVFEDMIMINDQINGQVFLYNANTGEVFAYEKRVSDHKCDRNRTTFKKFDDGSWADGQRYSGVFEISFAPRNLSLV